VHGVDSLPQANPHGGLEALCRPCGDDADCGPGGNFCLGYEGGSACGVACTADAACGPGYRCLPVSDDPEAFYLAHQCIPEDMSCRN